MILNYVLKHSHSTSSDLNGSSSISNSFNHLPSTNFDSGQIRERKRKRKHLQRLYQPPLELIFQGSLSDVRNYSF